MVPDGYYYGVPLILAGILLGWLAGPLWAVPAWAPAAFFLWFFRDPERIVPSSGAAIVSPADGKVTDISRVLINGSERTRISIFLSVFDVHVNRTPIPGRIVEVLYRKGKFLVASHEEASVENEQNTLIVEGKRGRVVCRQIAGLIARRRSTQIVAWAKANPRQ